jgi:hypothetical protein
MKISPILPKTFLMLSLTLSLVCYAAKAQENAHVKVILDEYLQIKTQIKEKKLLSNDFWLNANQHAWNETLQYQRAEKYYYSINSEKKGTLHYLVVKIDSSGNQFQLEYLFDTTGKLILWQEKQALPQYSFRELSFYFQEEKLILLTEDNIAVKSSAVLHSQKIRFALESGRWFWDKFQEMILTLNINND